MNPLEPRAEAIGDVTAEPTQVTNETLRRSEGLKKKYGAPLRTIIIGPEPRPYTPEYITGLREVRDDVRVEIQPEISEWSSGSMVLDTWPETGISGPAGTT